jgi:hypothetical protein
MNLENLDKEQVALASMGNWSIRRLRRIGAEDDPCENSADTFMQSQNDGYLIPRLTHRNFCGSPERASLDRRVSQRVWLEPHRMTACVGSSQCVG